jgi:cell division initiation protein
MPLTAIDITKQDFSTSLRGYNREEVRAFLDMVANELETLQHSESRLAEKVDGLENKLKEFQAIEQTLKDALLSAQEAAKQSQIGSERERELLLKSAGLDAERIRREAQDNWTNVQGQIHRLMAQKDSFIKRLKYILQSQQELIELLESEPLAPDLDTEMEKPHGTQGTDS